MSGTHDDDDHLSALRAANAAFAAKYAGERGARQPAHTLYLGAQFFDAETTRRLATSALRAFDAYGGDPSAFADAIGLAPCPPELATAVHARVRGKLEREAVEDLRIDFEDGFGRRTDDEEDQEATATARELARAVAEGTAPPFSGIRIKALGGDTWRRALRTVDVFVEALALASTSRALPPGFVVTLPKVTVPEQTSALACHLDRLEARLALAPRSIGMEFMVETTHAFLDADGRSPLRNFLDACAERCVGVHLGTYDFTASCGISAAAQSMAHPMCELARGMMILAYGGTGVFLSDGSTNVLPVGPHARGDGALTPAQDTANRAAVHHAWRLSYEHIRHSLRGGFYQGWDLHPAQLPVRYAACFAFYLEGFPSAAARLRAFVAAQAGSAHASGAIGASGIADEPATAQALWNYVRRAYLCGAIDALDLEATGIGAGAIGIASLARVLAKPLP